MLFRESFVDTPSSFALAGALELSSGVSQAFELFLSGVHVDFLYD